MFNFAVENTINTDGYISEKIFDAFFSGSIPIYSGPKNTSNYIPENTFININKYSSIEELIRITEGISYGEFKEFRLARNNFLIQRK